MIIGFTTILFYILHQEFDTLDWAFGVARRILNGDVVLDEFPP